MTGPQEGAVLILGGTSDIGGEIASRLGPGRKIVLAARNPDALRARVDKLRENGATEVQIVPFEATDLDSHRRVVERAMELAGPIGTAVVAFGILGDQERAEKDERHAADIAMVDYTAQVSMLTVLADVLGGQGSAAQIVAFSSIAGWRARRANYVYGSTKAGLDAFCQGLSDALHGSTIRLITVRPGFVIGSMTEGMTPAPMSVYPGDVADAVISEIARGGRRSRTLWVPRQLRVLAWVMQLVPRPVWRRMPR